MLVCGKTQRASDCGSEGRGFETNQEPFKQPRTEADVAEQKKLYSDRPDNDNKSSQEKTDFMDKNAGKYGIKKYISKFNFKPTEKQSQEYKSKTGILKK